MVNQNHDYLNVDFFKADANLFAHTCNTMYEQTCVLFLLFASFQKNHFLIFILHHLTTFYHDENEFRIDKKEVV